MRQAVGLVSFILSNVFNGIAAIGLVYVVTQDVTAADVVGWLL